MLTKKKVFQYQYIDNLFKDFCNTFNVSESKLSNIKLQLQQLIEEAEEDQFSHIDECLSDIKKQLNQR